MILRFKLADDSIDMNKALADAGLTMLSRTRTGDQWEVVVAERSSAARETAAKAALGDAAVRVRRVTKPELSVV